MKKPRKSIKILAIIFGIIILAAGVGWIYLASVIRPPEVPNIPIVRPPYTYFEAGAPQGENPPPPEVVRYEERKPDFFTFLIIGLTEGLNANTIIIASYDAVTREAHLISIPRDTRLDVERNNRKVVSSYPSGRLGGRGHEGGVARMKDDVQSLVGFRPDFYITVDYTAFTRMIDAVGGVEIHVPFHMYYNDPYQNLHIDLAEGTRVLNGHDALLFARYRTGTRGVSPTISDYQRIVNQQEVISALLGRLLTPASILRIPEFVSIFNEYVKSDLSSGELLWFANQARHMGGADALNSYTLPMAGNSGAPRWYEFADEPAVLELVNRTVNPFLREIVAEDVRIINR